MTHAARCEGTWPAGGGSVSSHHLGDASVCDADSDFGFLGLSLSSCHADYGRGSAG